MLKRIAFLISSVAVFAMAGGEMRVEEPDNPSSPPIDPEKESVMWHAGGHNTAADRAAIQERRRKVQELAEKIREKREAVEQSSGADREREARELKDLILDGDKELNKKEKLSEKQIEKRQEIREKQLENEHGKSGEPHGNPDPKPDPNPNKGKGKS
jgi:hypothetical protein